MRAGGHPGIPHPCGRVFGAHQGISRAVFFLCCLVSDQGPAGKVTSGSGNGGWDVRGEEDKKLPEASREHVCVGAQAFTSDEETSMPTAFSCGC